MPLVVEASAIGGIALGFNHEHEFTPEDRDFAMALARLSAQALERARLHDTERALRDEAEDARKRAEDANRAKSQFLATMSHELRTPLNAIAGYIQLLELGIHGQIPEKQMEILARVQRSQRTLLNLIDDILSFARLESGKVEYRYDQVPLIEVLRAAYDLIAPQLNQRGLSFERKCKDDALSVWTDREKFIQIVVNLFSNAVKFTDSGSVTVECERTGTSVRISVSDTGRGIPSDKLEAIFEPFVQAESGLTRRTEGSGLGLAISRDLARAMRGDLTVKSVEGKGSTFTLWLPASEGVAAKVES
jgi:signal transduction histidine kinase